MEHLFQTWDSFSADVKAAPHVLLLSDYDGTLTPIVSRPKDAVLSPGVREKLRALAANKSFTIGIGSGRSLSDVEALTGIEGIYYAGNHGLEIKGPDLNYMNPVALTARTEMEGLTRQFTDKLAGIEGALVENKGLSLSVHYRLVKEC
ncbi:trehalose-phosphatase [Chloroflexota bacterium]